MNDRLLQAFPLLADPPGYRACETDLLSDAAARAHWLGVFERQLPLQLEAARDCGATEAQVATVRAAVLAELEALRLQPGRHGRLDILLVDQLRQRAFRRAGIEDEMRQVKAHENDAALALLPERLAVLDAIADGRTRLAAIVHGMLAGNLFDMGVPGTAELYADAGYSFATAQAMVPIRPWLVDQLDVFSAWLQAQPPRHAVVFADNAGGDLLLGLLPLVRELLRGGGSVVLAANSAPSHNDITAAELAALLPRVQAMEPAFASPRLAVVASGSDAPLIDLRQVSAGLARAARDAELVVLQGMGRALETNWSARFTVPALKVAMVKDPAVAAALGGRLYDAVCRFDLAA
jgi:type II pantothenate kinase